MMIKRLLQKGADRDKQNKKGQSCLDIAIEKDNRTIINILQSRFHCQLCSVKMPFVKVERNIFNVIFFIAIHLFVEFFTFFILLPCN